MKHLVSQNLNIAWLQLEQKYFYWAHDIEWQYIVWQKTFIYTVLKEGNPQKVIAKEHSDVSKYFQKNLSGRTSLIYEGWW